MMITMMMLSPVMMIRMMMLSPCDDDNDDDAEPTVHAARGAVVTGPYLTLACLELRLDEHYKGSVRC